MAPRLKVFVTSDGLTDYVVATSSKAKALAAWGSHQDLFKIGLARETDDPELVGEATARPGEVVRRAAGGRGELAKLKPRPKPKAPKAAPAKAARPAGPSKAALAKVADLEKRLAAEDAAHARALEAIERRRSDLERQAAELEARRRTARADLEAKLKAARRALG